LKIKQEQEEKKKEEERKKTRIRDITKSSKRTIDDRT